MPTDTQQANEKPPIEPCRNYVLTEGGLKMGGVVVGFTVGGAFKTKYQRRKYFFTHAEYIGCVTYTVYAHAVSMVKSLIYSLLCAGTQSLKVLSHKSLCFFI